MRLGTAPPLRARLLAPQIYRREPDPKARGDHRRRQTGRISQQHPLAQISRIGVWHHCLLQEANHSTHMQHAFQIHTESALVLQLSLEVRWRAAAAPFPMTDLGGGLMQASPD
jgi:hypothetical protein